ncbi:MAG: sensor domain-containing protein [Chloroflexi bacterium]|nr:sensor domain-containing protein [Chloroflexota bacterium]
MTYNYNPFAAAYPTDRGPLGKIFKPVIELRTYLRGAHMMLMFPLGIAYFVFFVTTLAVGGSMIWTLVGPIVLLATLFVSRWLGDLEAFTAGYVNGSSIRRPPFKLEGVTGFRSQVKVRLVDPTTWTGLIYLFVQFPIGIAAFITLVVVYAFAGSAVFSPVGVLFTDGGGFWDFVIKVKLIGVWEIDPSEFPGSLLAVPIGILGFVLASHLILAFSSLHGWWAKLMLGSRSTRVSSRPATDPTGDEPPKPSTAAELLSDDTTAIAVSESELAESTDVSDSEIGADDPDEDGLKSEPEIESPATAARISLSHETAPPKEPYLKPVPNPSEFFVVTDLVDLSPDLTPIAELTAREQEVFMLMAHGDTNADIAEELFISEGTVKTHVKRVLSKLYMRDRTQIVVFAYEKKLVVPGAAAATSHSGLVRRVYGG